MSDAPHPTPSIDTYIETLTGMPPNRLRKGYNESVSYLRSNLPEEALAIGMQWIQAPTSDDLMETAAAVVAMFEELGYVDPPYTAVVGAGAGRADDGNVAAGPVVGAGKPSADRIYEFYDELREYYKGQLKSANKLRTSSAGVPASKVDRRNEDAAMAYGKISADQAAGLRQLSRSSVVEYGKRLYERRIKYGNCGEMSALSAYRVKSRYPENGPWDPFTVSMPPNVGASIRFEMRRNHPQVMDGNRP
jgi:hypothetical protein